MNMSELPMKMKNTNSGTFVRNQRNWNCKILTIITNFNRFQREHTKDTIIFAVIKPAREDINCFPQIRKGTKTLPFRSSLK